jgi:hypothetical protein
MVMLVAGEHRGDHAEVVAQPGQALLRLGKAVAVGEPLVCFPAGADPELHSPAADRVHRRDHLRGQGGFRNAVQITMWPSRTRSVIAASADSEVNDSNVISSVGRGTVWK